MRIRSLIAIAVLASAAMFLASTPTHAQPTGFERVTVATGLSQPTAFAFKGAKIFVTEKASGKVQVVRLNGALRSPPYVTLNVSSQSERGLLGIAMDPSFETNGFVYVYYTTGPGALAYSGAPKNRVSRFTTVGGVGTNETIILDNIPSDAGNHNGGDIQFGPDGYLYVAVGDGGTFNADALAVNNLRGKILRVGPKGKIPPDNPYGNAPGARRCGKPGVVVPPDTGACREIYAYGLRNPFRLSLRQANGSILIGDVGHGTWEELNTLVSNGNYGWNVVEGPCPFGANPNCVPNPSTYPEEFEHPIHFYKHSGTGETGETIIAGAFAENGTNYPAPFAGAYFYADFEADWIHVLTLDANNQPISAPVDFAVLNAPVTLRNGPDGNIYVLSFNDGALYKYTFAP
jgi:glucose/arabinose dehydrogenase